MPSRPQPPLPASCSDSSLPQQTMQNRAVLSRLNCPAGSGGARQTRVTYGGSGSAASRARLGPGPQTPRWPISQYRGESARHWACAGQPWQMAIAAEACRRARSASALAGNHWSGSRLTQRHRACRMTQDHDDRPVTGWRPAGSGPRSAAAEVACGVLESGRGGWQLSHLISPSQDIELRAVSRQRTLECAVWCVRAGPCLGGGCPPAADLPAGPGR